MEPVSYFIVTTLLERADFDTIQSIVEQLATLEEHGLEPQGEIEVEVCRLFHQRWSDACNQERAEYERQEQELEPETELVCTPGQELEWVLMKQSLFVFAAVETH